MNNKTVLITGSNGGIGRALVNIFAHNHYNIIAHELIDSDSHNGFLKSIEKECNITVRPVFFDLTDSVSMRSAVRELSKENIAIDVLVNCAGIAHGGLFQMTSIDMIRKVFDINFFSMLELTQLLIRPMVKRKSGCIINFSSISGLDSKAGNCAYGTSKAAVISWTKTLATELAPFGIRVNAIAPGLTDTNMAKQMEDKAGAAMISDSAMNRLGRPEEIANVALFLASDKASFVNGQVIRVDGGSTK